MKIIKPLTLGLLHKPYRYRGQDKLVIASLGFFKLGESNARYLTENLQWPKIVKALPTGRPIDEVMPKSKGEILLSGKAFAPEGKPTTSMQVRVCVDGIDKSLRVIGDRQWSYGILPWFSISEPTPFTEMPLVYERSYGGPNYTENPVGRGYTGNPIGALVGKNQGDMPNIEYIDRPVTSHWKQSRPAGFAPIDMTWIPRKHKHGTFDQQWLDRDAPGLAQDVDWTVFNTAPEDQWLSGFFHGGECYRLEGLHPLHAVIEGKLPETQARTFILREGTTPEQAEEVPMHLDTIWFFPEQELGVAVYRGQVSVADRDALDIAALMIAYEHPSAPKSVAHYRETMDLRLNFQTAALHAFNESQLAPHRTLEEIALRKSRRDILEAEVLAKQQAVLDEMSADFWKEAGIPAPADYVVPQAKPLPLGIPASHEIEEGDFDLSELISRAKSVAEAARDQGIASLVELEKRKLEASADLTIQSPSVHPDVETQKVQALARASVVAYDLLPDLHNEMLDPQSAELMTVLEQSMQAGSPITADQYAAIRQGLLRLPALKRKARNAALTATAPAQPLANEAARWLGLQIAEWVQGGASLAGRDLAGADLRGIDFSGTDLREAMLEQADLTDAIFRGANLEGAVLTGCLLDGSDFSDANLSNANLCMTKGEKTRFTRANLSRARAIDAAWNHADLSEAMMDDIVALRIELHQAVLDGVHMHRALMAEAKADASSWRRANLDKSVLLKANLEHADFSEAVLVKTVLMDAILCASVWNSSRLDAVCGGGKADWSRAAMRGVVADGCGLRGASFAGADLRTSHFLRCDFGQCDLRGADMRQGLFLRSLFMQAVLHEVQAEDADFFQALGRKADFSRANLRRANLVQMELTDAIWEGALLDDIRLEKNRKVA